MQSTLGSEKIFSGFWRFLFLTLYIQLGRVYNMPAPLNYDPDDPSLPGMSLRDFCEAAEMSYSRFARDVPCSPSYPRMIATGQAWPGYSMAKRIEELTRGAVPRTRWYPPE